MLCVSLRPKMVITSAINNKRRTKKNKKKKFSEGQTKKEKKRKYLKSNNHKIIVGIGKFWPDTTQFHTPGASPFIPRRLPWQREQHRHLVSFYVHDISFFSSFFLSRGIFFFLYRGAQKKGRKENWMEFFVVQIAPGPPYECIYTWGGNMSLKNKFFFPSPFLCCCWNVSRRRLHIRFPPPEKANSPKWERK